MKQPIQAAVFKHIHNERGFTLLEMLIVLTIFMVISASILYVSTENLTNYTNEQIIDQTEIIIRLAQTKAIETKSIYEFYVLNCREMVVRTYSRPDEDLFKQTLPKGMEIHVTTNGVNRKISFKTNGNISNTGTIVYHLKDYSYKFSINMGKGRMILKSVDQKPRGDNTCGYTFSGRDFIFSNFDTYPTNI